MNQPVKPVRAPDLVEMKSRGERIAMLTAYDATMARLLDRAGVDAILVGDSLGMVVMGHPTTIPVTMDAMVHHTAAVARGVRRALVIADMPFLSYQTGPSDALRNAGRLIREGGAAAVKIEGGRPVADIAARLVEMGIPVVGHVGLTPNPSIRSAVSAASARPRKKQTRFSKTPWRWSVLAYSLWCSNRSPRKRPAASRNACRFPPSASARDPTATGRSWSLTTPSACARKWRRPSPRNTPG